VAGQLGVGLAGDDAASQDDGGGCDELHRNEGAAAVVVEDLGAGREDGRVQSGGGFQSEDEE
jgi:hypothetical protein